MFIGRNINVSLNAAAGEQFIFKQENTDSMTLLLLPPCSGFLTYRTGCWFDTLLALYATKIENYFSYFRLVIAN